jgi:hypothetical protein
MPELLGGFEGEYLELDTYQERFEEDFWTADGTGFWKLERQQYFREPGNPSWEAYRRGDWQEALRLIEDQHNDLLEYHRKAREHGITACRVRIVEFPIVPYLQWELHALRLRDATGGPVRVIGPESVAHLESAAPLPETATLGSDVLYEAVYDDSGALLGGRRFADKNLVARCRDITRELFSKGEELSAFFAREVATLPPPAHPS